MINEKIGNRIKPIIKTYDNKKSMDASSQRLVLPLRTFVACRKYVLSIEITR